MIESLYGDVQFVDRRARVRIVGFTSDSWGRTSAVVILPDATLILVRIEDLTNVSETDLCER